MMVHLNDSLKGSLLLKDLLNDHDIRTNSDNDEKSGCGHDLDLLIISRLLCVSLP